MKKILHRMFSFISALAMTITMFSSVLASYTPSQAAPIYKRLSITNSTGWSFETSGPVEKITSTTDGWIMQAGGDAAFTHYSRVKYKIPENAGVLFTSFYAKAVIVLPADFYTQQKAGFRILNTDNYQTTLNGAAVGASNANELRVSVYIYSDHKLRLQVNHETGTILTLYTAPAILPTGEHTFELAGDVANNAPWYLKVDGVVVASGIQRLSTDDMADSERVITRVVAGIDGAADQSANPVNLLVKSLEIANYDMSGVTPTSLPPTATLSTETATPTVTASPMPVEPTVTAYPMPAEPTITASPIPVEPTVTAFPVPASPTVIASPMPAEPTATASPIPVEPPVTASPMPAEPTVTASPIPVEPTITLTSVPSTITMVPTNQPALETIYDDKDSAFVYSAGWEDVSKKQAYNGSFKQTTRKDAFVTFTFTGQSFSILYRGGPDFRKMGVYVDGVLVTTIDEKTRKSSFQQRWDYTEQLVPGTHTLKLVFVTPNRSHKTNGSIDAVIVR